MSEIDKLIELGNDAFDDDRYADAIEAWTSGYDRLDEPKVEQDEAMWLQASIGEAYAFLEDWQKSLSAFRLAHRAPGGTANPLVLFGIAEASFMLDDKDTAKSFFTQAYMVDGEDIFEDTDPDYLAMVSR